MGKMKTLLPTLGVFWNILAVVLAGGPCREGLSVLSVHSAGLGPSLQVADFDKLRKERDLFVIGVADHTCTTCCQSEGILADLLALGLKTKGG
jgi:hypothetical protein